MLDSDASTAKTLVTGVALWLHRGAQNLRAEAL
jgi:hypothetical protein